LWEYECLSGFHRAVQLGVLHPQEATEMMNDLLALEIERVAPTVENHLAAFRWAERLGQSKVYDAQYVALAEHLKAELWSADQRLVTALKNQGVPWAHWIGEV
jgi:predicted nucleic acid-binding protein